MADPFKVRMVGLPGVCFNHGGVDIGMHAEVREPTWVWTWRWEDPRLDEVRIRTAMLLCDSCKDVWVAKFESGDHVPGAIYELRAA